MATYSYTKKKSFLCQIKNLFKIFKTLKIDENLHPIVTHNIGVIFNTPIKVLVFFLIM